MTTVFFPKRAAGRCAGNPGDRLPVLPERGPVRHRFLDRGGFAKAAAARRRFVSSSDGSPHAAHSVRGGAGKRRVWGKIQGRHEPAVTGVRECKFAERVEM